MKTNQLKIGVVLSYLIILLNCVISLLFTPVLLHSLGQSEYGLYSLIGGIVGYITIFDFGLNNTIVRYVSKFRAEKDKKGESNFLAASFIIYSFIALCIIAAGVVIYFKLGRIFSNSLTFDQLSRAKVMFAIMIFNLSLNLPFSSFQAIMLGYERFIFPKLTTIIRMLVRTALLVVLLNLGFKAMAIVVLDTSINLIIMLSNTIYVLKNIRIKIYLYEFSRRTLRDIFSYSFSIFLGVIAEQAYWQAGQLILGIATNTETVAVYAVGMQFAGYYTQFSTAISGMFLPKATRLVVNNSSDEELTALFIRVGRLQFIILGFILMGFMLLGKQFIVLWAGKSYSLAWLVAVVVMLAFTVPLLQSAGYSILQAKKLLRFTSIMYGCITIFHIAISVILVRLLGALGAALGTACSLIIGNTLSMNIYYFKTGLNIPKFFKEVSRGLLPSMVLVVMLGFVLSRLPGSSWLVFLEKGISYASCYAAAMWLYGMNDYEKELIAVPVKNLKGRFNYKIKISKSTP